MKKDNFHFGILARSGFTLIELLVVIAIIGVLSSIVLASLNNARKKGNDGKVEAQLSGLRAAAEIGYSNLTNTYSSTGAVYDSIPAANANCAATANTIFADTTVVPYVTGGNFPTGTILSCHITATGGAYAVSATLSSGAWCVDSKGTSKYEGSNLPNGTTQCL